MKRDNGVTRRYLAEAGVGPGQRVLEIGCGGGEVTEALAELVGPTGAVVAIDRHQGALAQARERLAGHTQVEFVCADAAGELAGLDHLEAGIFDVLAGRRVLMYLREPAAVLGRLGRWLRSGGLVVFEESDLSMVPARLQPLPAHDRAADWIRRTLVAEGAHPAMGLALPATLIEAGYHFERVRAEAVIQGQGTQYPMADLLQLLAPRVAAAGVATRDGVEVLRAELDAEGLEPGCVYVSEMSFCASGRKA